VNGNKDKIISQQDGFLLPKESCMCQCPSQYYQCRLPKVMGGVITLGLILPFQLYLTGMALRSAMYSPNTISFVHGGLGIILFIVGFLLLLKGLLPRHSGEGCEKECQDKCSYCK
jgi:hypothetical protein